MEQRLTPERVRAILDPERRRAGFDAWKAEQREALRTGRVGDSEGTCPPEGLDDVGQPSSAAAHPGEVETRLRFSGNLSVSNPRFPSLTGPPLAVWRDLGEAEGASPPDEAELTARLLALGLIQPEGLAKGVRS